MMRFLLVLTSILLCSACTTNLKVQRVDTTNPATRVGAPYPLLFTRYEIKITRQVTGCGNPMKVLIKAEIKGAEGTPDPGQLFVIDTNSLASPVKTSAVSLGYLPNGAVSSLNATAEDKAAQVISNVVSTAVKVASIAAAPGAAFGAPAEACSKSVLKSLEFVTKNTPIVKAAVRLVDSLTEDIKALNRKITLMGSNVDERTKAALGRAYDSLLVAIDDLENKETALEKSLKIITYVETVYWPDNGNISKGESVLPEAVLSQWGRVNKENPEAFKNFSTVFFNLKGVGSISRDLETKDDVNPELGVPYRLPVLGKLSVCAEGECGGNNIPIAEKISDVLQLGYVYYLPCKSRPFTSISCTFAMLDNGQLKSMGTAQLTASAEALSGVAKDTAASLGSLQETLASAKTKRLEANTAALKAQADYAAAAIALQPDVSKPEKDETAGLKAEIELLNAKRAKLEAEAALAEALAKGGI